MSNPDSLTGLPVGAPVAPLSVSRPERITIEGRYVVLTPLDPALHAEALYPALHGPEQHRLWLYLFDGPYSSYQDFQNYLRKKAGSNDPLFFAILDRISGRAMGHAALMRIDAAHGCIEVGSILYSPALQRTPGATEAMYLLARHIFEDLGYRRYEWKCDSRNEPSRRAARRLGFTFEGIFRQHMIVKGRNRDTAWFSMLDSEWPEHKANFECWLDPANFDSAGRQKLALSQLNGAAPEIPVDAASGSTV